MKRKGKAALNGERPTTISRQLTLMLSFCLAFHLHGIKFAPNRYLSGPEPDDVIQLNQIEFESQQQNDAVIC